MFVCFSFAPSSPLFNGYHYILRIHLFLNFKNWVRPPVPDCNSEKSVLGSSLKHLKDPRLSKWYLPFQNPTNVPGNISVGYLYSWVSLLLSKCHFAAPLLLQDFTLATVDTECKKWDRILNLTTRYPADGVRVTVFTARLVSGRQLSPSDVLRLHFCSCLSGCTGQFAVSLSDWSRAIQTQVPALIFLSAYILSFCFPICVKIC